MSFVQRELDKIAVALCDPQAPEYDRLYAAQQALSWAVEPDGAKSPYDMIMDVSGPAKPEALPDIA